jgi:hypothetical protein
VENGFCLPELLMLVSVIRDYSLHRSSGGFIAVTTVK